MFVVALAAPGRCGLFIVGFCVYFILWQTWIERKFARQRSGHNMGKVRLGERLCGQFVTFSLTQIRTVSRTWRSLTHCCVSSGCAFSSPIGIVASVWPFACASRFSIWKSPRHGIWSTTESTPVCWPQSRFHCASWSWWLIFCTRTRGTVRFRSVRSSPVQPCVFW